MKSPHLLSLALLLPPIAGYAPLSPASLRTLSGPSTAFDLPSGTHLAPLLHPRVPGTDGSAAAQAHISTFFATRLPEWTLEWQNSTARTPAGEVEFVNMVFRRDPPGSGGGQGADSGSGAGEGEGDGTGDDGNVQRLMLAAHYDTLSTIEGFVGAVDSAAPCAILMRVAEVLEPALARMWRAQQLQDEEAGEWGGLDGGLDAPKGLQVVFFDGEEAFGEWSVEDSLYGSRSLAQHWESTTHPSHATFRTPIDSIELLVLLDLLGAPGPTVPSYYPSTHWAYRDLAGVEHLLRTHDLLQTLSSSSSSSSSPSSSEPSSSSSSSHSSPSSSSNDDDDNDDDDDDDDDITNAMFLVDIHTPAHRIGLDGMTSVVDDHVPFLHRGVDVVHLVPAPFPWDVWHRAEDDGDHLDLAVVADWAVILAGWVGGWMEAEGFVVGEGEEGILEEEEGTREHVEL